MAIVKDRGNPQSKVDQQLYSPGMWDDKPYQGVVPMTVGTTYTKGRSIMIKCTAAGNVSLTYQDGSTQIIPVPVGITTVPGAVVSINATGTTATATYDSIK